MDIQTLAIPSLLIFALILALTLKKKKKTYQLLQGPSALQPKHRNQHLKCPLVNRIQLNHDTFLFTYALPSKNQVLGIYVGQHIFLHEHIKTIEHPEGELVERKYTPTSTVNKKATFDLLVKIYRPNQIPRFPNGGKLTPFLEKMNLNDEIHISGPYGRLQYLGDKTFQIKNGDQILSKTYSKVVMIAGGTGITPMYQIIQAIVDENIQNIQLYLLFANKTESDILLYEELKKYAAIQKLNLSFTLDNPPENWTYFKGFVTKEMVSQAFGQLGSQTLGLTCGPGPMNQLAKNNYLELGMDENNIFIF